MTVYDITNIHGSRALAEGVAFLDTGVQLQKDDQIVFPCLYRIIFRGQSRAEMVASMREIQSWICCKDYRR